MTLPVYRGCFLGIAELYIVIELHSQMTCHTCAMSGAPYQGDSHNALKDWLWRGFALYFLRTCQIHCLDVSDNDALSDNRCQTRPTRLCLKVV